MYVFGNDWDELGFCGAGEGSRRIPWPCQETMKQSSYLSKKIQIAIEVPTETKKALGNNNKVHKTTLLIPKDAKPCFSCVSQPLFQFFSPYVGLYAIPKGINRTLPHVLSKQIRMPVGLNHEIINRTF